MKISSTILQPQHTDRDLNLFQVRVMAESFFVGASLINIFVAVWLVNVRLYPMSVSLIPLLKDESQPRWKYYLSCHFLAVSSWLIMKNRYQSIDQKYRIDFWIGIGIGTWGTAIFSTLAGYFLSDYLNKDMTVSYTHLTLPTNREV